MKYNLFIVRDNACFNNLLLLLIYVNKLIQCKNK